uniref:hyaluronoglucosaminidase n=1 Tax=Electrophorus electricus TaxID=8005 RepID=A0A4W4GET4_ELEEL
MQGNNGHLPVFVAPANGSAGYTAGKVVPGRLPVPTKAPPPPPLKRLSPPPARPPPLHPSEDKARREHAQNLQRKNTYICTGVFLGAPAPCNGSPGSVAENCPDHDPTLIDWNPGTGPRTPAVVRRGDRFRLVASASLQSLTIQSGGLVVFADDKDGSKNITLRTRHILIEDGGALHIGGPECRYRSRAIVGLVGRSDDAGATDVPGFGRKFVGVRPGGTLELHGARRLSWTLLTRTLPASGLSAGSYAFQKNFSRGINLRVVDQDTGARLHVERFDTHEHQNDSRRLSQLLRSLPPGRIVALAVGDSAVKSLLDETKKTIQDVLGSTYVNELQFRQAWALVSVVGGGNGSCTEAVREHENHDTRGRALAHRNFVTADGVRFAVTAYSEWRNGYASSGFTVDVEDQVVLDLQDDVSSWRPGERVVVASTDYSMHQAEEFTLLPCPHCTKRQVRKPQFTHVGEIVDGVDMRAEVALLTRNILVHGEMESTCYGQNKCQFFSHDTFGGHIKILGNFSSVHLSQVELRHMGQQAVLGSYPVHFHRCGDVDRHGGYAQPAYVDSLAIHHSFSRCVVVHATNGLLVRDTVGYDTLGHCFFLEDGIEQRNVFFHNLGLVTRPGTILPTDRNDTMCTEIRDRVYKGHVPSPATECKAVSTFWIANPNNHLISNAAAGSQDAGIWYVFHSSSTGDSHGLVPETRAELTPLGIFYNNRIHSNFKAGLFIDKGVKTSNASAADPREYLCLDNSARFRPHENSDPAKPRVAALVDALISFKNNDLGAWIRGGDVIIQNSACVTLPSDGSYPKDVGSSQEVADSLFVGESKNRGTNGGLNKYWGLGGVDGKLRTLPRNKTFPIRGFQIYDGPVRLLRSTFRAYAPTPERFTSAVGFNLKNTWQLTPRNNLSSLCRKSPFGPRVTLRAFFGRPGQWFEDNDLDGDKNSIFHDVDGSVSGYPGTYVARADNFLVRHPACVDVPQWNGCVCSGRYAQVYIKTQGTPNLGLSVTRDEYPERPMLLRGINSHGALSQQYQPVLMLTKSYTLHWSSQAPREVAISLVNFDLGDWAFLGLCYPSDTVFQVVSDIYDRQNNVFDGMEDYGSVSSLAELQKRPLDRKYFFDSSTGLLWLYVRAQHGRSGYSYCSVRGCERVKITATTSTKQTCNCTARAYPKYRKQPSATTPMPPPTTTPCTRCGASKLVFSSDPSSSYLQTQIKALSLVEEQNNDTRAFITVRNSVVSSEPPFCRSIVMLATRAWTFNISLSLSLSLSLSVGSFAFFGFQGVATRPPWVSLLVGQGEEPVGMIERYIPLALEEYSCPLGAEPAKRKDLELLRKSTGALK